MLLVGGTADDEYIFCLASRNQLCFQAFSLQQLLRIVKMQETADRIFPVLFCIILLKPAFCFDRSQNASLIILCIFCVVNKMFCERAQVRLVWLFDL